MLRRVRLFGPKDYVDPMDLIQPTYQASLGMGFSVGMGFSRQAYWNGLLFPSSEDLSDPGIEPVTPAVSPDRLILYC